VSGCVSPVFVDAILEEDDSEETDLAAKCLVEKRGLPGKKSCLVSVTTTRACTAMASYLESREVVRVGLPSLQLLAGRLPLGTICRSRGSLQSPPKVKQAQRHCFAGHFDCEAHGDLGRIARGPPLVGDVGGGAKL